MLGFIGLPLFAGIGSLSGEFLLVIAGLFFLFLLAAVLVPDVRQRMRQLFLPRLNSALRKHIFRSAADNQRKIAAEKLIEKITLIERVYREYYHLEPGVDIIRKVDKGYFAPSRIGRVARIFQGLGIVVDGA